MRAAFSPLHYILLVQKVTLHDSTTSTEKAAPRSQNSGLFSTDWVIIIIHFDIIEAVNTAPSWEAGVGQPQCLRCLNFHTSHASPTLWREFSEVCRSSVSDLLRTAENFVLHGIFTLSSNPQLRRSCLRTADDSPSAGFGL